MSIIVNPLTWALPAAAIRKNEHTRWAISNDKTIKVVTGKNKGEKIKLIDVLIEMNKQLTTELNGTKHFTNEQLEQLKKDIKERVKNYKVKKLGCCGRIHRCFVSCILNRKVSQLNKNIAAYQDQLTGKAPAPVKAPEPIAENQPIKTVPIALNFQSEASKYTHAELFKGLNPIAERFRAKFDAKITNEGTKNYDLLAFVCLVPHRSKGFVLQWLKAGQQPKHIVLIGNNSVDPYDPNDIPREQTSKILLDTGTLKIVWADEGTARSTFRTVGALLPAEDRAQIFNSPLPKLAATKRVINFHYMADDSTTHNVQEEFDGLNKVAARMGVAFDFVQNSTKPDILIYYCKDPAKLKLLANWERVTKHIIVIGPNKHLLPIHDADKFSSIKSKEDCKTDWNENTTSEMFRIVSALLPLDVIQKVIQTS